MRCNLTALFQLPSCSSILPHHGIDNFKANEEKLKATVAQAQEACAQGNEVRAEAPHSELDEPSAATD